MGLADMTKADKPGKKPSLLVDIDEKAPASSDDMTTDEDESASDVDAAAGEAFDCLKSGDREGFITAMKAVKAS